MEVKAKRTIVKSAPELWELADDLARLEAWTAGVVDSHEAPEVEVTRREPERVLAWRTASGEPARIAIELAESGFGTSVSITAWRRADAEATTRLLEQLLDELGSPERRPFTRA